jgi:carbon-monoxide dehydrogenase medium subunit
MRAFDYREPTTAAEACAMLVEAGSGGWPLCGGTDLLIQIEQERVRPETLVYLGRVAELQTIDEENGGLRIGGAATLRAVELHPVVRDRYPALERGAAEVGSVQIRNLATLAGNLCNASPSADTSPALLAYDAEVEISNSNGRRTVPVAEFWRGPGRTVLETGELVTAIRLPPPPAGLRSFYRKLAVRKAMDLAMVGVCITAAGNGRIEHVRIALGAVAPVCLRAAEAEEIVRASDGSPAAIEAAARAAVEASAPISDHRATAGYRREMVRVLTARGLAEVLPS